MLQSGGGQAGSDGDAAEGDSWGELLRQDDERRRYAREEDDEEVRPSKRQRRAEGRLEEAEEDW